MNQHLKQGDFSNLAKQYIHRTGYSLTVLNALARYAGLNSKEVITADVGAGTGKLTQNLIDLEFKGYAIEPNDAMREEGIRICGETPFSWVKGSAENTRLPEKSVDWILMGSSFHWTDREQALQEFHRILKPNGHFVALWNPRTLTCPLQIEIEEWIHTQVAELSRKSSGGRQYTQDLYEKLLEGGYFKNVLFMEAPHVVEMSKDRYLGAWMSVNDIRSQAGEKKFEEIMKYISEKIADKYSITVSYQTRAWIAQAT